MFSKFQSLKPEKQQRILNAALQEFGEKGYKKAATDNIVREAEISKGALFHYFNSKKDLFLFLYDYTLETVMKGFFDKIDLEETDLLKRLRQVLLIEFMLIEKHPDMLHFIQTANAENCDEIKHDLESRNADYITDGYRKVLSGFDITQFKEGTDIERAVNIIIWSMEGFAAKEQAKLKAHSVTELHFNEILSEMDLYFELLRTCFYR